MDPAGAKRVGDILLGEVEEGSLEELLNSLRANFATDDLPHPSIPHHIPIPDLSAMIHRHHRATQAAPSPLISVCGRYLPFLYHFISTLIAAPHNFAVVVVDAEGKFDVTRLVNPSLGLRSSPKAEGKKTSLPATTKDLAHVYVYRPESRAREHVDAVLSGVDEFMVYGDHESKGRAWWGTVVVGGIGGDVNAGWKGWCRVDREGVVGFAPGISVEEALRERGRRHEVVDQAGWSAASSWGTYVWKGG